MLSLVGGAWLSLGGGAWLPGGWGTAPQGMGMAVLGSGAHHETLLMPLTPALLGNMEEVTLCV